MGNNNSHDSGEKGSSSQRNSPICKERCKEETSPKEKSSHREERNTIEETISTKEKIIRSGTSTALDFVPGLSNVKGFIEFSSGKDYITGEKLTKVERAFSLISSIPGGNYIKAANGIGKVSKIAKNINKSEKIFKEEKQLEKISQNVIKRHGAFNEAKKNSNIPRKQQPDIVRYNKKKEGDWIREYTYKDENIPNRVVIIREDKGHTFDDPTQNRGPHFNVKIYENDKCKKDKKHYEFEF